VLTGEREIREEREEKGKNNVFLEKKKKKKKNKNKKKLNFSLSWGFQIESI
jgi:hypothetical protein